MSILLRGGGPTDRGEGAASPGKTDPLMEAFGGYADELAKDLAAAGVYRFGYRKQNHPPYETSPLPHLLLCCARGYAGVQSADGNPGASSQ